MTIHIHRIPHRDNTHRPLGRHVEHDDRSRGYAFTTTRPAADKTTVWPTSAPVLDQGKLGACIGNATAQLINCAFFDKTRQRANHGHYLTERDAREIYSLATHLDNIKGEYPPTDTGSSGIAAAKAGEKLGYFSKYTHAFGFDHFRAAIQTQPVIVGTLWTKPMFTPNTDGLVRVGEISDATIDGGHEYLCRGIDYERRWVLFRNSCGAGWGCAGPDNTPGSFYISFDDFAALLGQQGDVTAPVGIAA